MTDYTLQPIPGKTLSRRLPEGTALVLEGGGLRGYYSCGVMEVFMEKRSAVSVYYRRFGGRSERAFVHIGPTGAQPRDH